MSATTYTTIAGDTWDMIALRALGSEQHVPALMDANPAHVWTLRFGAGVVLALPSIASAAPASLPPWRRPA